MGMEQCVKRFGYMLHLWLFDFVGAPKRAPFGHARAKSKSTKCLDAVDATTLTPVLRQGCESVVHQFFAGPKVRAKNRSLIFWSA